jgi:hypothetical protein
LKLHSALLERDLLFAPRNDQNWIKGGVLQKSQYIITMGSVQSTCLRLPVRIQTQDRCIHRQVDKSVIRGEKTAKAKKYSLTGK